jgi:hypothetical protein
MKGIAMTFETVKETLEKAIQDCECEMKCASALSSASRRRTFTENANHIFDGGDYIAQIKSSVHSMQSAISELTSQRLILKRLIDNLNAINEKYLHEFCVSV